MYQHGLKKPKISRKVNEIAPPPLILKSFSFWHTSRMFNILPKHHAYLINSKKIIPLPHEQINKETDNEGQPQRAQGPLLENNPPHNKQRSAPT